MGGIWIRYKKQLSERKRLGITNKIYYLRDIVPHRFLECFRRVNFYLSLFDMFLM